MRQSGRHDTSDITQEGCLQLAKQFQGQSDPEIKSALLRKMAIGYLCKFKRANQAAKRAESREEYTILTAIPDANEMTPDQIAETRDLAMKLIECLATLEKEQREVIVKRFFEDKTFDGIAVELGMTRYRVTEIYQLTIKRLQQMLSQ